MNKEIKRNRETSDYDMFYDGQYIGSRPTYSQAETALNEYVYELLMHQQN